MGKVSEQEDDGGAKAEGKRVMGITAEEQMNRKQDRGREKVVGRSWANE